MLALTCTIVGDRVHAEDQTKKKNLPSSALVVRVIDGDTFEIEGGEHVRLASINAPETGERVGDWATEELTGLILRKEVALSYGVTIRDHYQRLIATVKVGGEDLETLMVRRGAAYIFIVAPARPDNYKELVVAQKAAREEKRGLWADESARKLLTITSFHANAEGRDNKNLKGEYLRIDNTATSDIDLEGFTLTNRSGQKLVFPKLVVPVGYTFKVISGKGSTQGNRDLEFLVYWNSEKEIWNDHGDKATIRDPAGNTVVVREYVPKSKYKH